MDVPFQLPQQVLLKLQELLFLKKQASTFQVFLKPQTADLTIEVNVKEDRIQATSSSLGRILCPLEQSPPILVFKGDKTGNIFHTHKRVYHITNKSLMATSGKGLMVAMTLHSKAAPWHPPMLLGQKDSLNQS